MDQWLAWVGTAGSVILAIGGFYMGWRRHQGESLRSRDVAQWADRAIAMLMTIEICAAHPDTIPVEDRNRRLVEAIFASGILVEQGRLFFRNVPETRKSKGSTYAGRRPRVLDPLVVANKIAARLLSQPGSEHAALLAIARKQRRLFVQLVQLEIGRRQSASWEARRAGEPTDLGALIAGSTAP